MWLPAPHAKEMPVPLPLSPVGILVCAATPRERERTKEEGARGWRGTLDQVGTRRERRTEEEEEEKRGGGREGRGRRAGQRRPCRYATVIRSLFSLIGLFIELF